MKITSKILLMGTLASFFFFSCKKNNDNNNNNSETVSVQDRAFIRQASLSNTAEIQAGNLADSLADSSVIKTFAQQMVNDHTTAQNELKSLGDSVKVPVTDSTDSAHVTSLDSLRGLTGRIFDSVYIINQIADHNAAISNFQQEISNGNKSNVISYANKYLPTLQSHLQMADSIATEMHFK